MGRRIGALLLACSCLAAAARAQTTAASGPTEYEVKAAYLFNFGRFVQWPASKAGGVFELCVLGPDPFGMALDRVVTGALVSGRTVRARRIASPDDASPCHIVFVSAQHERLDEALAVVGKAQVLTVGDSPQFLARGGMIQFVLEGSRVRFQVNLARAQSAGLVLSSELLRVATRVQREAR